MYKNYRGKPMCGICKKEFVPPQRAGRPSKYCSWQCQHEAVNKNELAKYHMKKHTTFKGTIMMFRILNRTLELKLPELK